MQILVKGKQILKGPGKGIIPVVGFELVEIDKWPEMDGVQVPREKCFYDSLDHMVKIIDAKTTENEMKSAIRKERTKGLLHDIVDIIVGCPTYESLRDKIVGVLDPPVVPKEGRRNATGKRPSSGKASGEEERGVNG